MVSPTVPPPKMKVHCIVSEKMKLYSLLDSAKRLSLHARSEVLPDYGSGLSCVVKEARPPHPRLAPG